MLAQCFLTAHLPTCLNKSGVTTATHNPPQGRTWALSAWPSRRLAIAASEALSAPDLTPDDPPE